MMRTKRVRFTAFFMVIVFATVLLTSCDVLFDKSKEEIKLVVEGYLAEVKDLSFVKNAFESDFSTESIEKEVEYYDARSEDAMHLTMENMTFEVIETSGSKKTGEGICNVSVTLPDLEKIITGGSDDSSEFATFEEFEDQVKTSKARTKTQTVSFYMKYNQEKSVWEISDTGGLKDLLINDFASLHFGHPAGNPEDRVAAMFTALAAGDQDMLITMIDEDYVQNYLFPLVAGSTDYSLAIFSTYTYEVKSARIIDAEHAEIDVDVSFVDAFQVLTDYVNNEEKIVAIYKQLFIQVIGGEELTEEVATRAISVEVCEDMRDPEAPMLERSVTFMLETDASGSLWTLPVVPEDMFPKVPQDADLFVPDSFYYSCVRIAIKELYDEDRITKSQYDNVIDEIERQEAGEAA
jgi:hypothetical protein